MKANPMSYEDPSGQVYTSMDGVGVKQQRSERRPDPPPKRRRKHPKEYVYSTLAQVDHDDGSYVLVGSHTLDVLRLLLAFLLDNGLWKHGLTFLTDGQKTLQGAILRAFCWWGNVRLILDWYHLDKKGKEELKNSGLKELGENRGARYLSLVGLGCVAYLEGHQERTGLRLGEDSICNVSPEIIRNFCTPA